MTKSTKSKQKKTKQNPLCKKLFHWILWITGSLVLLTVLVYIAFQVSPWPSALLIRSAFNKDSEKRVAGLEKYVPSGIDSVLDQQYKPNDKDAYFDAYYPSSTAKSGKTLPTIVWVHGGGWISGDKSDVANYLKILAGKGYTAIGINYSIAPEKTYPTPVIQANQALKYINENAERLHVDKNQIVLAGDSAGSQIAAQVAVLSTNPSYAKLVDIAPALKSSQLSGMLLNCGAYDIGIVSADGDSEGAKLLKTFLWSYSGRKDFMKDDELMKASVIDYVTPDFPPTFITAGNDDPLLPQSKAMAKKLRHLNVETSELFYPKDYSPKLPHEYQFNLDTAAGKKSLEGMTSFLQAYTKPMY